jgi:hypothetical protein
VFLRNAEQAEYTIEKAASVRGNYGCSSGSTLTVWLGSEGATHGAVRIRTSIDSPPSLIYLIVHG